MILVTALRTMLLDFCMDTIYKKLKANFAMHTQEGLKYLQDCYLILSKIHDEANQPIEITFEEYRNMYNESIINFGYDFTHSKTTIFDRDRLQIIYQQILESESGDL